MSELLPTEPNPPDQRSGSNACGYCGAQLNAFYYFCTACGTPYKHASAVISRSQPKPLSEGELIERTAPGVRPLLWTYFIVVLVFGLISAFVFQEDRPGLALFLQSAAMLVTTCVFAVIYHKSLAAQLRHIGFDHWQAWLALALLAPALGINWAYFTFLMELEGVEDMMHLDELRGAGMSEMALIVVLCVFPAVTEEIAFRGLLQHWLQVAIRPMRAIVLSSFLFAAFHFSILSMPYLFAVGFLLGWAKYKTGSLYPSMLIHLLHNLIVIELFDFV